VISGAEQTIQALWHLSAGMHGFAIGSALYGTVLGAFAGGWPTDRFGRKADPHGRRDPLCRFRRRLRVLVECLFLHRSRASLAVVGIGISTVAAPLYISEISPPAYRGRLAGMFQFNIVFGIIVAFLSNYLLKDVGVNAWRWMLGVAAFPSVWSTRSRASASPRARAG
jgi:MFS transporter, SP family, arabinose:H+ symporter